MSCLATSEVGHGERSDKAAPDRTLLGPQGPAPNLEGRLSAAGDHAACALRNTGGRGGLRRSPALGCEEPGLPAPVLPFNDGLPSHDTLNDVINALDPALFKTCFVAWVEELRDAE